MRDPFREGSLVRFIWYGYTMEQPLCKERAGAPAQEPFRSGGRALYKKSTWAARCGAKRPIFLQPAGMAGKSVQFLYRCRIKEKAFWLSVFITICFYCKNIFWHGDCCILCNDGIVQDGPSGPPPLRGQRRTDIHAIPASSFNGGPSWNTATFSPSALPRQPHGLPAASARDRPR